MKARQKELVRWIVKEYIKMGKPISSKMLFEKGNFKLSGATLRIEMRSLAKKGYLKKSHPFSGSTPTSRAYQFFLENFCSPRLPSFVKKELEGILEENQKEETFENLVEKISFFSKNLAFILWERMLFWRGLFYLFSAPEFSEIKSTLKTLKFLEKIFKKIEIMASAQNKNLEIHLGKVKSIGKCPDLSLIFGRIPKGMVGILGPLRMDYQRNIALVKKVRELLETL